MTSLRTIISFLVICQVVGEPSFSFKLPRYDELFYLASPKRIQEPDARAKALLSQFYDSSGRNHLENMAYEASHNRNSDDPLFIKRIVKTAESFICKNLAPNVSLECCRDTEKMFWSVLQGKMWALKMLDSYGKPTSGMLEGNIHFGGSMDECLEADTPLQLPTSTQNEAVATLKPKYCQVGVPIPAMEAMKEMLPQDSIAGVVLGVCIPDTCQKKHIEYLINKGMHMIPFNLTQNTTTQVRCPEDLTYDAKATFALVILGFLISMVVLGTLIDICVFQLNIFGNSTEYSVSEKVPNGIESGSSQVQVESFKKQIEKNIFVEIFLCFSMYKNGSKLLNTNVAPGSLGSVHGIRFISMLWVILGHSYIFGLAIWRNLATLLTLSKRFSFQVVANALFSVDTFFMLSGMLVTYGIMKGMKKTDGKNNWIYFYVHRIWRLTPPYMLVMMVYIPLFQYWGDGPYWPQTGIELNYCQETWYYNLLYINNFLADITKGMCMPWTWYLSNDMQFYVISPLILYPLYKKPKIGGLILCSLLLAHLISCGVISTVNGFGPTMFTTADIPVDYFKDIYIKPYTRIGPYLIGMMYGYLLYKTECKVQMNTYIVGMVWLFSSVCALCCIYGLYDFNNGVPMPQDVSSLYTALARTIWGLSVGWVIFACCTGYGGFVDTLLSWKALVPLSRLTYCAYLVHPILMQSFYLSQRFTIYLTDYEIMYLFFGNVVTSYAVAFFVSMTFEAPMIALETLAVRKLKNRNK